MKRYEALFLFDTAAARDWASMVEEVRRLCGRIGAELLVCVKFDERKLAYEIGKRKRGTYALAYLDAPPNKIGDLERDVNLSETILRALVLRTDKLTEERLAELRAHPAETSLAPLASESRRHDDDRRGHDRPWRDRGDRGDRDRGDRDRGDRDRGDRRERSVPEGEPLGEPEGAPAESAAPGQELGGERE